MSAGRTIALLSDFGHQDGYVGMMKGAIAYINPCLNLIDLTHDIPPQAVDYARFVLMTAFPYFPPETVFLAVVDPGVGSQRRGVAIEVAQESGDWTGFLVGPDNGLFSGILEQATIEQVVELTNSDYWRTPQPSFTFHGRDIFAPVAAHLASGVPIGELGQAIAPDTLTRLSLPPLSYDANGIIGCIQAIDHFGNLIMSIPGSALSHDDWSIELQNMIVPSVTTYSDRSPGTAIALIGSHGWVELAIVNGNARTRLELNVGDRIKIFYNK